MIVSAVVDFLVGIFENLTWSLFVVWLFSFFLLAKKTKTKKKKETGRTANQTSTQSPKKTKFQIPKKKKT